MAETVRSLVIKIRTEVEQSQAGAAAGKGVAGAVGGAPGTPGKPGPVLTDTQLAAKFARTERTAVVSAMAAERRKEELHVQKMNRLREEGERKAASVREREESRQQAAAAGPKRNWKEDITAGMGSAMAAMMVMKHGGGITNNLGIDLAGGPRAEREGFFTSVKTGIYDAIANMAGGSMNLGQDIGKWAGGQSRKGEVDWIQEFREQAYGEGPKRTRGTGANEGRAWQRQEESARAEAVGRDIAGRNKEIEAIQQQIAMTSRLIERRKDYTRMEDEAISRAIAKISSLNELNDEGAKWFGSLSPDKQAAHLQVAKKVMAGTPLTKEESEIAGDNPLLRGVMGDKLAKMGRKAGWNEMLEAAGFNKEMEKAQDDVMLHEGGKRAQEKRFAIDNNIEIGLDLEKSVQSMLKALEPKMMEVQKRILQAVKDEIARERALQRANENPGL